MGQTDIDLISMFMLGLLGSGHCLGMCGPLVIALPGRYGSWHAHILYHSGRLATYIMIGAIMGAFHQGLIHITGFNEGSALNWTLRIQIAISLLAAVFLLILGLNRIGFIREPAWMAKATPQKIPGFETVLKKTLDHHNAARLLFMGYLLGFLPCGLSYGAFARTLAAPDLIQGALLAGSFGLGTLPVLLFLGTGGARLLQRYRLQTELLAGVLMIGMALGLFANALRALN